MRSVRLTVALLALFAMIGARGAANQTGLSVTGSGTVTETPDVGKVFLTVQVKRPTASAAREQAATTTAAVNAALANVTGVNAADITTTSISLYPDMSWSPQGVSSITGYVFQQTLQVKVADVTNDVLASVVDTAVSAGGNNLQVSSVSLELSPALQRQATNRARRLAVQDATNTATTIADAAGVTLDGPISIIDQSSNPNPTPVPFPAADAAMGAAPEGGNSTPVTIGPTDVTASVSMVFAFTQG